MKIRLAPAFLLKYKQPKQGLEMERSLVNVAQMEQLG